MEHFSLSGPRFHGARPAAERCVPVAEQWKSVIAVVRRLSGFRSAPVVPEHLRKHDLQHTMNPMISRTWLSAVALAALAPLAVAQNFSYSDQDVLLAIRPTAANSSTSSLLMNLGPVSSFYNAAPGTSFSVGSTALVGNTFSSLVGLSYSFSAANKTVTSDAAHPLQTLWVSRGRVDPTVQSDPWQDKSSGNLANTATKISTLGSGATTLPAVPGSSGNAVLIPNSDTAHNVGRWIGSGTAGGGSGSTYNGTFQGNSEVTKLCRGTRSRGLLRGHAGHRGREVSRLLPDQQQRRVDLHRRRRGCRSRAGHRGARRLRIGRPRPLAPPFLQLKPALNLSQSTKRP